MAKLTSVMPGPDEASLTTGICSREASQAAIRSALGFPCSARTVADWTVPCGWSSVAASSDRQGVALVQLRSVSPGW